MVNGNTIGAWTHGGIWNGQGYCYSYQRKHNKTGYASGKEVKYVGEFRGFMLALGRHVVAKTKSRKLKPGGGFKKWPAAMDAHLSGTLRHADCDNPFIHATPNKAQDRRRVFLNGLRINSNIIWNHLFISHRVNLNTLY